MPGMSSPYFLMAILISSISSSSGSVQSDGISHHFAGAGEIHSSSIDDYWKTTAPTYVMNWAQPQGPIADLAKSNSFGLSGESHMLASWAAVTGPFEVDQFARWKQVPVFKTNPCAPRRWCTPYSTGYVFNTMRK